MTGSKPPSRFLLVGAFDDALNAHTAQRRRALERLGAELDTVDLLRTGGLLDRLRGRDLGARLSNAVSQMQPDLVIVIGGASDLAPEMIAEGRAGNLAPWVNWFPDDLRTIEAAASLAPSFDQVWGSGSGTARRLGDALGRPVGHLAPAADPSVYRPMRSRDQFRANVVFAGVFSQRREELLAELVEFGLAIWGPGWRRSLLRDYCRGERLVTEDYVRAYAGASVAVNIHHTAGEGANGVEADLNQRTFELAAIGVPQVVDQRDDLAENFAPAQDMFVYRNGAELKAWVKELLHDRTLAERMAESARQRLLGEHTYMHRMRSLLEQAGVSGP